MRSTTAIQTELARINERKNALAAQQKTLDEQQKKLAQEEAALTLSQEDKFFVACEKGDAESVKDLLKQVDFNKARAYANNKHERNGKEWDSASVFPEDAINIALQYDHPEILRLLIEQAAFLLCHAVNECENLKGYTSIQYRNYRLPVPTPCDFKVLVQDSEISNDILFNAKNTKTPIILKKQNKLMIYGEKNDNDWQFTDLGPVNQLYNDVLFCWTAKIIKKDDLVLTQEDLELFAKGHAPLQMTCTDDWITTVIDVCTAKTHYLRLFHELQRQVTAPAFLLNREQSLLLEAVFFNSVKCAKLLIEEFHANPSSLEYYKDHSVYLSDTVVIGSALTLAIELGHTELALLLIEKGANTETPYGNDQTEKSYNHMAWDKYSDLRALLLAAKKNNDVVVSALLKHGADTKAYDRNGKYAIDLATDAKVIQLLKDHAAALEVKEEQLDSYPFYLQCAITGKLMKDPICFAGLLFDRNAFLEMNKGKADDQKVGPDGKPTSLERFNRICKMETIAALVAERDELVAREKEKRVQEKSVTRPGFYRS